MTTCVRLTEVCSGAQQTVVDEVIDEWRSSSGLLSIQRVGIMNIYCSIGLMTCSLDS